MRLILLEPLHPETFEFRAHTSTAKKTQRTSRISSVMISEKEVLYFMDGFRQGIRSDGRSCDQMRPMKLTVGVVPTANGSCRVQSKACDIFVAIKCEVATPSSASPNEGLINVSVEFGCSVLPRLTDFTGRQAALESDSLSATLASHLQSMCLSGLDKRELCISPGRLCWLLSVDVLIERIDCPFLDPISIGIRGALQDLRIPLLSVPEDSEERKFEIIKNNYLNLSKLSNLIYSVGIIDNEIILIDLNKIEENLSNNLAVSFSGGDVAGIHKFKTGSIDPFLISAIIREIEKLNFKISNNLNELFTRMN